MNTQQLESFIQVAENLNYARAAEVLNITRSAISRQINSLESELGTKLFNRSTRNVSLTPSGISFLEDAKEVLAKLQSASIKIQGSARANIQTFSIACINESNLIYLSKTLSRCRLQIPEMHPHFRIIPHRSIVNLFIHGEIDVLFGFKDDIPIRGDISYKEINKLRICCAVPAGHPYASKKEIYEKELYTENIIVCNSYEIPYKVANIQNRLEHQFLPECTYYCENLQVMLAFIKAGYGFAILPEGTSVDSEIIYIPLAGSALLSHGIFYKRNAKNPLLHKFITTIKQGKKNDECLE